MNKKELLGYCGLYCGDCGGHTGEIANSAKELIKTLERYEFEKTARGVFPEELSEYDEFHQKLKFISGLICEEPCRDKDLAETRCEIKKCCRDKGYFACYECDDFKTCDKFDELRKSHGNSCVKNLLAIREMGLDEWIESGERLWFGDNV